MTTHSSILAWRIPRTEKPGGLQSIGSRRVRHDQAAAHTQALVVSPGSLSFPGRYMHVKTLCQA